MAISLDSISLPDLVIENEFGETLVESRVARSLGGGLNVWEQSIKGKSIDLVGDANSGWITRAALKELYALASVPNAAYILDYEGTIYTVRFRNEDPPAIEATPVVARPNHEDTDEYSNVRIKLMEID